MPIKSKLLIYLAIWRRPEITELCFMGLNRLRKHPAYDIDALAVISEPEMISLCNQYGIKWIMHENLPLGKKKNAGLLAASVYDFDYLMEIGSDDLITDSLLTQYIEYLGKYDFFGISDAAYIESETGICRRLITDKSTYGAGRMISRKVLEKVAWRLWNDNLNRGLDNDSVRLIEHNGFKFYKVPPMNAPGVIDVKSDENLWKFNYFLGHPYNINSILPLLSECEVSKLNSLQNVIA
jgi:hypothetical protein